MVLVEEATLTLDVQGVGYELRVPGGTLGRTSTAGRDPVTLWVQARQPRDGTLELFGFASEEERSMFRLLLTVQKVGPGVALKILGSLSTADLVGAILGSTPGPLTAAPGVGKAMAEEIVNKLKKKRGALPLIATTKVMPKTHNDEQRLIGALTNMGYRPAEAERALTAVANRVGKEPLPELLKAALATLV